MWRVSGNAEGTTPILLSYGKQTKGNSKGICILSQKHGPPSFLQYPSSSSLDILLCQLLLSFFTSTGASLCWCVHICLFGCFQAYSFFRYDSWLLINGQVARGKQTTIYFYEGSVVIWTVIFKYKLYIVNLKLVIIERNFRHSTIKNQPNLFNKRCSLCFLYLYSF